MRCVSFVVVLTTCAASLPAAEPRSPAEISRNDHSNGKDMLLRISAFPNGDRNEICYCVNKWGFADDWRDAGFATQDNHFRRLSESELQKLHLAIRALPAKSVQPRLERLVKVSFWDDTTWVTRTYDSESLPQAMRQIYEILGERFETRKEKELNSSYPPPYPRVLPKVN